LAVAQQHHSCLGYILTVVGLSCSAGRHSVCNLLDSNRVLPAAACNSLLGLSPCHMVFICHDCIQSSCAHVRGADHLNRTDHISVDSIQHSVAHASISVAATAASATSQVTQLYDTEHQTTKEELTCCKAFNTPDHRRALLQMNAVYACKYLQHSWPAQPAAASTTKQAPHTLLTRAHKTQSHPCVQRAASSRVSCVTRATAAVWALAGPGLCPAQQRCHPGHCRLEPPGHHHCWTGWRHACR
jgi:hypothetical protein